MCSSVSSMTTPAMLRWPMASADDLREFGHVAQVQLVGLETAVAQRFGAVRLEVESHVGVAEFGARLGDGAVSAAEVDDALAIAEDALHQRDSVAVDGIRVCRRTRNALA